MSAHAHSPEDGSEMLAENSGTIFVFISKNSVTRKTSFQFNANFLRRKKNIFGNSPWQIYINKTILLPIIELKDKKTILC